MKMVNFMLTC